MGDSAHFVFSRWEMTPTRATSEKRTFPVSVVAVSAFDGTEQTRIIPPIVTTKRRAIKTESVRVHFMAVISFNFLGFRLVAQPLVESPLGAFLQAHINQVQRTPAVERKEES